MALLTEIIHSFEILMSSSCILRTFSSIWLSALCLFAAFWPSGCASSPRTAQLPLLSSSSPTDSSWAWGLKGCILLVSNNCFVPWVPLFLWPSIHSPVVWLSTLGCSSRSSSNDRGWNNSCDLLFTTLLLPLAWKKGIKKISNQMSGRRYKLLNLMWHSAEPLNHQAVMRDELGLNTIQVVLKP